MLISRSAAAQTALPLNSYDIIMEKWGRYSVSRVRMPIITVLHLKRLLQVMVNLEAQKNVPSWDRRLKRKQYSLARMVFSQYEHELRAPKYE